MIRLDNVSKYYDVKGTRRYLFRDVNLTIPAGINVGIVGRNGAGKSTLLRMLGGIDFPSSGRIETHKRISWPVGLGGGFQGSLTGRENARFVCRLYNLDRKQIREKLAFIEEFSELGRYLDMPIKTYSSGMRSRLTFSTSMAFDFDYYIFDEVLSVGDQFFKKKCEEMIQKIRATRHILMVSHGMPQLQRLCDCGLLVQDGELHYFDDIREAVAVYQGRKVPGGGPRVATA